MIWAPFSTCCLATASAASNCPVRMSWQILATPPWTCALAHVDKGPPTRQVLPLNCQGFQPAQRNIMALLCQERPFETGLTALAIAAMCGGASVSAEPPTILNQRFAPSPNWGASVSPAVSGNRRADASGLDPTTGAREGHRSRISYVAPCAFAIRCCDRFSGNAGDAGAPIREWGKTAGSILWGAAAGLTPPHIGGYAKAVKPFKRAFLAQ